MLLIAGSAQASLSVNFFKLTNNNLEDLSGQLGVTIFGAADNPFGSVPLGANDILMVLTNNVGIPSNVTEFYVDDGTTLSGLTVFNSLSGLTNFVGGSVNPGNLPGGNTAIPPFVADGSLSADTAPGPTANGVNAAVDAVGFRYGTAAGIPSVVAALTDGSLRLGLHVRSIGAAGGSDSYVNVPPPEGGPVPDDVPEPGTIAIWGLLGTLGAALSFGRRRQAS
jgi:hypothetical protein